MPELSIDKRAEARRKTVRVLTYILLVFWAIMVIFPFYWMLLTSVKTTASYDSEVSPVFFTTEPTAENYENAQKELRSAREALKHNDDERPKRDELTLDVFSSAVERFTGICGRLPYMRNSFMVMDNATRNSYDELLRTVEGWCAGSRKALNAIMTDGGIIIE